jgi:hypothetical protein
MAFTFTLGFATEHDKADFEEKIVPKIRGQKVDAPATEEGQGLYWVGLSVTSQSAAKEVCHMILAFLAHSKSSRVTVEWTGADGHAQVGEVEAGTPKGAEVLAMRVGTAAKAHLDSEKAAAK